MERETTQQTLSRLRDSIEHFDPKEWFGCMSVDMLWRQYEAYKIVAETLNYRELKLISLLRGCEIGETQRFVVAAEKLYDAYKTRDRLDDFHLGENT